MSYCRWSTDDYQCDLYVYESASGWVTHIAGNRLVFAEELPPVIELTSENVNEWFARDRKIMKMIEDPQTTRVAIGLPHDCETFTDSTASECADRLQMLKDIGYRFPDGIIEELRAEKIDTESV